MLFRWVVLSAALHLLVAAGVLVFQDLSKSKASSPIGVASEHDTIEVLGIPGNDQGARSRERPKQVRPPRPKLSLAALGWGEQVRAPWKDASAGEASREKKPKDAGGGTSEASWIAEERREKAALDYLYHRIDRALDYPDALKEAGIEGAVSAELRFKQNGSFVRDQTTLDSANRFLRVTVWRALRLALTEPLPENLRLFDRDFTIRAEFQFEFTEGNTPEVIASRRGHAGLDFFFYRNFHHSRLQWKLGPLRGMAPIPIVGLDVVELVESVASLFSGKSKKDPLDSFREDADF